MRTAEEIKQEIERFNAERNEALLSLDEQRIRAMVRKWNGTEMPKNMKVFWGAIHKAISGATSLPLEFRQRSKAYLDEQSLQSLDDGELGTSDHRKEGHSGTEV